MALTVACTPAMVCGAAAAGAPAQRARKRGLSRPDELSELNMGKPVDYSFKRIASLDELERERPRELRVGKVPSRGVSNRFMSASLWLNHNQLSSLQGLVELARGLVERPYAIAWLDFSFNNLSDIADEILSFPQLRILYLHGNQLSKLSSVAKLRHLASLRNLTLRGNPLEELNGYRSYIIALLPQIQRLDYVPVSCVERHSAPPAGFAKKKAMLLKT